MPESARQVIWQVVAAIPRGKVATYGQVATLAGRPGYARFVGTCLKGLPPDTALPWHRVVNASGKISLAPGSAGYQRQKVLLEKEGINFKDGRFSLRRYQWQP